jgi:predicted GNAT family acetyltransferase
VKWSFGVNTKAVLPSTVQRACQLAMTGERSHATGLREVSGVCTHPRAQGQGLARKLVAHVVARQLKRGELPFLHVMSTNINAHGLYGRMGFKVHRECVVRVVSPSSSIR